jgi:hypothetical protein
LNSPAGLVKLWVVRGSLISAERLWFLGCCSEARGSIPKAGLLWPAHAGFHACGDMSTQTATQAAMETPKHHPGGTSEAGDSPRGKLPQASDCRLVELPLFRLAIKW